MEFKEFEELRDEVFSTLLKAKVFYISHINGKIFYIKAQCLDKKLNSLNEEDKKKFNKYFSLFKFQEEAWYCLRFKDSPYNHICPVCKDFIKFQITSNEYGKTCSKRECSQKLIHSKEAKEKIKQTNLEKYGVDNPAKSKEIQKKIKQTNLEKYGVEYGLSNKIIREKIKQTNLEKYGVDSPFASKEVKEKIKQVNLNKRGVDNPFLSEEVKEKIKQTNLEKYGFPYAMQNKEIAEKSLDSIKRKILNLEKKNNAILEAKLIEKFGNGWYLLKKQLKIKEINIGKFVLIPQEEIPKIENYYNSSNAGISLQEKELFEFVKNNFKGEVLRNKRNVIPPYELDIYIPEKKVAIEYDGLYWHSTKNLKDKNYHLNKTKMCEEKGIRLIHIFSDEWMYKKEIVESIILSSLGNYKQKIYARECEAKEISLKEYKDFLNENHIQGEINSKLRIGLFYKGELVQVAGWGYSRFKKGEIELHRMATKKFTQVIGGFSKLIKHSKLKNFVSFVDRRLFNGKGYTSSGFKLINITEPSYFYLTKDFQFRENRIKYQKHKLSKLLESFNPSLTEEQNMLNNGRYRIFDCGEFKMEFNRPN